MKIEVPKTKLGQFVLGFVVEMVAYFLFVANTRAFTHDNYLWTAITDSSISLQAFVIGKFMVEFKEARTWSTGIGLTLGGMTGSMLAIFITKRLY